MSEGMGGAAARNLILTEFNEEGFFGCRKKTIKAVLLYACLFPPHSQP